MRFTFLGTGTSSGIPLLGCSCPVCTSTDWRDKRLRCAGLLEWDNKTIVIDAGQDFRQQMLRENVKHIDAILITHAHMDHIGGLDELRAYNFAQNMDMPVYADALAAEMMKKMFAYIFAEEKYPGVPNLDLKLIEKNKAFNLLGKEILPLEVLHGKMPVTAFKINDFAYVTDAKYFSDETTKSLKGIKTLVINAVRIAEHHSHLNLKEALAFIEKIKAEKAYLIHISHRFDKHTEIEKMLPPNVKIAYDGLQIDV